MTIIFVENVKTVFFFSASQGLSFAQHTVTSAKSLNLHGI
jgi:hypothetical protein